MKSGIMKMSERLRRTRLHSVVPFVDYIILHSVLTFHYRSVVIRMHFALFCQAGTGIVMQGLTSLPIAGLVQLFVKRQAAQTFTEILFLLSPCGRRCVRACLHHRDP